MKILRVDIKNIASLANAVIDFEKEPLASAPIFLINGPTGAGKTTILNAICIALYNDAPCLRRSGSTMEYENASSSNPIQLLRRGAGRGSVILNFEDDNGWKYTALWEAHRKRDKPDGAFQKLERALTCHHTGETITNQNIINKRVPEIIGLTFDQFCRTTMLAQGEFARFLHGKDEEKGEILEKLTGMELYSRISHEIYQRHKQKQTDCEMLQREINGANLLEPEEEEQKLSRSKELDSLLKDKEQEAGAIQKAIEWLDAADKAAKQLAACESALQKAINLTLTDEAASRALLVKQWHESADIRALSAQAKSLGKNRESLISKSQSYKKHYANLLGGVKHLECKLKETTDRQLSPTIKQIKEMETDADVFSRADAIAIMAKQVGSNIASEKEHRNNAKTVGKEISDLAPSITNAENKCSKLNVSLAEKVAALDACSVALEDTDAEAVVRESQRIATEIGNANNALSAIEKATEAKDAAASAHKQLNDANAEIKAKEEEERAAKASLKPAKELLQAWQKIYEGRSSLKSHIVELQKAFEDDGECPLCGSKVEHLHCTEQIDADLSDAIAKRDEAKENVETLNSTISACATSLTLLSKQADAYAADAASADTKSARTLKKAISEALKCEIDASAPDASEILATLLSNLKDEQKSASAALQDVFNKQNARDKAQKEKDKADKALADAQKECLRLQTRNQNLIAKQATFLANAELAKQNAEKALAELKEKLPTGCQCDIDSYPEICNDIAKRSAEWKRLNEQKDKLEEACEDMRTAIESAKSNLSRAAVIFPETEGSQPREVEDLVTLSEKLADDSARIAGSLALNAEQIGENKIKLEEFYTNHPQFSAEDTARLSTLSKREIDDMQKAIDEADANVQRSKGALEAAKKQRDDSMANKPEMPESADALSLRNAKEKIDSFIKDARTEKASIDALLADNTRRRESVKDKEAQLRRATEITGKWAVLKSLFGSSDGKVFKMIAQSAVLQVLLHNANFYMKQLAPRYRLTCEPDRLGIFVTDLFSGNTRRHSTLLSGGETFVVSLALALSLANINKQRSNGGILFIDEGFGSLSAEYLNAAVSTLQSLHSLHGGKVGIISHVESMVEQIPVQIRVRRKNRNTSTVEVCL